MSDRPHTDSAFRRATEALGGDLGALRRSLEVYYGDPARDSAMDALYARFVKPGGLAFDIGSHVGDRICSFRRLGARVVALEPQPDCATVIRAIHGGDADVSLVQAACGAAAGILRLHINSANPTVTTASQDFVRAADGANGWEGQVWDRVLDVPVTTLDDLIAQHGKPDFIKIDVEGFEDTVLSGLSVPVPALGYARFNVALGESQRLSFAGEISADTMRRHLSELPHDANSGDVYAFA
jgi:FkbM family methyltransferase